VVVNLRRVGPALLLGALLSCSSGPAPAPEVKLGAAMTREGLHAVLESISSRTDLAAMMARARIYARLRELEKTVSPSLLALGDSADIDVLSHGASPEAREESAGRLAAHFRERAENPVLSRSSFPGHLGEPLRRIVLLLIAGFYAEIAPHREQIESLTKLSEAALSFAERESLSPEAVRIWRKRAKAAADRAAELGRDEGSQDQSAEARKFCEYDPERHLAEGTRAADLGTREKADRADAEGILQWYLLALAHYAVVRETASEPTAAQEHALAGQEIIVRSLCDMLCREP
jgi:hypothetical protein